MESCEQSKEGATPPPRHQPTGHAGPAEAREQERESTPSEAARPSAPPKQAAAYPRREANPKEARRLPPKGPKEATPPGSRTPHTKVTTPGIGTDLQLVEELKS